MSAVFNARWAADDKLRQITERAAVIERFCKLMATSDFDFGDTQERKELIYFGLAHLTRDIVRWTEELGAQVDALHKAVPQNRPS